MNSSRQTVMVTGAGGNLGRAVVSAFSRRGANLICVDKCVDAGFGESARNQDSSLFILADLLDAAQVDDAVNQSIIRFGRIDVLCNLAGGFCADGPIHKGTDREWDFLFDVNVRSLLNTVRAVVPQMIRIGGGKVINVGAHSALQGRGQIGAYCAIKGGVHRITESMSEELRCEKINVNCVLPTILDTPENRAAMPQSDSTDWLPTEDLADVICFLASHEARAIHGAAIPVRGGIF
jgi:NAD(P)-dependent dehydrogenase (short-subunit alcohol dehydrogenase family)